MLKSTDLLYKRCEFPQVDQESIDTNENYIPLDRNCDSFTLQISFSQILSTVLFQMTKNISHHNSI